jgi:hypothetical protein
MLAQLAWLKRMHEQELKHLREEQRLARERIRALERSRDLLLAKEAMMTGVLTEQHD